MEQANGNNILIDINEIEKKLYILEKEKEIIQKSCTHKEVMINFDETRSIKRYCSECKRELGYATKEEEADFLKPKGQQHT